MLIRTIIVGILLVLVPAAASAQAVQADRNRPVTRPEIPVNHEEAETLSEGVTGAVGDVRRTVDRGAPVRSIEFGELGNRPCIVNLRSYAHQSLQDAVSEMSQCNNRINTSQYWTVSIPTGFVATGLQACFNRNSGRIKGLRLFYDEAGYEGVASEMQPNCRGNRGHWAERIDCPGGQHIEALRVHFRQEPRGQINPIIGLQIICRT